MEHARTRPRGTRRALIAAAALACTAVALYPTVHSAHADSPALSVLYRTSTAATADEAEPWLEVVNNTSTAIPLSQVTLRYYFSADTTVPYTFACAWAVPGCSNLTGTVVTMADPTATADHYLQISFDADAGSLAPGANSGDLELRLYRSDWQDVNQADDWSFTAADTGYTPSEQVTAYVNGALVWGVEPNGGTASPTPTPTSTGSASPTPTPTPTGAPTGAPPSGGTLFDDFDYTGPNDPSLNAHDWTIRTGSGGPGIANTWTQNAISFPSDPTAQGGKPPPTAPTPRRRRSTPPARSSSRAPTRPGSTSTTRPPPARTATTSTRPSTPSPRTTRSTASWTTSTCRTAAGARPGRRCTPPAGTAPTR